MSVFTDILRAIFASASTAPVDINAELAARANPEGLQWQTSIVDLMKLLGLDSSLSNRTQLAKEFGYKGATDGSASMNMWLHAELMRKLRESGGRLPSDLH